LNASGQWQRQTIVDPSAVIDLPSIDLPSIGARLSVADIYYDVLPR
jgi:hypothetical protein